MKTAYLGDIPLATDMKLPHLPKIVEGQVYMVDTEMGPLALMTQATYTNFGTMCETLRNVARHLERKMREQNQQLDTAQRMLADVTRKYTHLKETTQAQRRASLRSVFTPGAKAE